MRQVSHRPWSWRTWTWESADPYRDESVTEATRQVIRGPCAPSDPRRWACVGRRPLFFKHDTPLGVGPRLRDTTSACRMVARKRIRQTKASRLLIAKDV